MRKKRIILEDDADLSHIRRKIIYGAVTNDDLAGGLANEACDNAQTTLSCRSLKGRAEPPARRL